MRDLHPPPGRPSEAQALLHAVEVSVADAENDLDVVLLQPLLLDLHHPSTARFAVQREQAGQVVAQDPEGWTARAASEGLEAAWRSLRDEARRTGLGQRPWRDRRRIRRARRLLRQAGSDRGSPASRVDAYRRGLRLLEGLITVPEPLRRSIYEVAAQVPPPRTLGPGFPTWG